MKQFAYKSHKQYLRAQKAKNRAKSTVHWVPENELVKIAALISDRCEQPEFGICHGARTGFENTTLSRTLNAEVIGTDLVGNANITKMDFHDKAPQWKGKADFIYTNSLDHSYDPELAIRRWIDCIKPNGIICIHWGPMGDIPDTADCFRASANEYQKMLLNYGKVTSHTFERYRPKKKETIETILFILTPSKEKHK